MAEPSIGMVLGKFLPPHAGHELLINFARAWADELIVVVGSLTSEPIPGPLRVQWMRRLFPDVTVLHLAEELPQHPDEHPEFWSLWRSQLERILPRRPTHVFASEPYGARLAMELSAEFVPVDLERRAVAISGTEIREDPWAHIDKLPAPVRAYYLRRVCIFGPESTGKTTLARRLAERYETAWVPEYARAYLEALERDPVASDMARIARGQRALEDALAPRASRLLFTDTDVLTTTLWSEALFGACEPWMREAAGHRAADLTLLLDVDVPWVEDEVRYLPEERRSFFDRCLEGLERAGRRYRVIRGGWAERWDGACEAVDALCRETGWSCR